MRPFFFRNPGEASRADRRSETRWQRRQPTIQKPSRSVGQRIMAWLRGEGYDPSVAPKWLRKRAKATARAAFVDKCRRRALRSQGCSIPGEVWR